MSSHSGSYQNLDARGYQVLINYRNTPQVAQSISLRDVLNSKYHPTWIENHVVLIGVTASSVDSDQDTPLGKLPKLHVQAQMLSSILSASEGERPQISWLPIWVDTLWIGCWSLVGTGLVLYWRSRLIWLWSASVITWGIVYGICWALLIVGLWLPLIPAAIALFITEAFTVYWISRPKTKETSF
ncbi:CHASE2 domain-containing protein [Leptolyngbyaceae cyanobacterium UHCC 1019]